MDDNILYYETSASDNAVTSEPDPTIATRSNVRGGYMFKSVDTLEVHSGTMVVNQPEVINLPPSTDNHLSIYVIPSGYHTGRGRIVVDNLKDSTAGTATSKDIALNKVAWVNGQRIVGTLDINHNSEIGDAKPEDLLDTRTAWVNGKRIIGTMPYNFRRDVNLSAGESYTIPVGYHAGTSVVSARSLYDQTRATATASEIKKGFTAWSNGVKYTGTLDAQADIEELIAETNTLQENVLEGHKFFSKPYSTAVVGTMPDHTGEPPIELRNGDLWNIPAGYYNGLSKIHVPELSEMTPGTAISSEIVSGRTAWVNGVKLTGSMVNNSPTSNTILAGDTYVIPSGYHTGAGIVIAETLANQTVGNAINTDIRKDKIAWVNGEKVTGSMVEYGITEYITLNASERYNIPTGYHKGGKVIANSLASQTPGNAYPTDMLSGKTAWVNGRKITGTIDIVQSRVINLESGEQYKIPKGYHSGTGFVIAPSTADSTPGDATAEDIVLDKTAWVYGHKIIGTLNLNNLDATVTEDDVLLGKTFYNNSIYDKKVGRLELIGNATPEYVFKDKTFYSNDAKTILTGTMELSGDAATNNVLAGKTFYTTDPSMKYTGSMINRGAIERELNAGESYVIPNGYHNGAGVIKAKDIASQTKATADRGDILFGKTAWVNGDKFTGAMPNRGAVSQTLSAGSSYTIPKGYHNGSGIIAAQGLAPQTSGTATNEDILFGKTAWVNGNKITGTIPVRIQPSTQIDAGESITLDSGYYDNSFVIDAKPNVPSYMANEQGEADPDGEILVLVPSTIESSYDEDEGVIIP